MRSPASGTKQTRDAAVKTEHVLFVASGAFHRAKPWVGLERNPAGNAQDLADKLARLPPDPRQRGVPADLPDAPLARAPGGARVRDDGTGLPARDLGCGVLTGLGADMIIIDDPLKPEEALSQTQRRAANEWFDHTLYGRLGRRP